MTNISYSPQGDLVVSASDDKSVRLWNVESGQCRAVIQDFHDGVNDVAWIEKPSGIYIVAGCRDGVVGMWQVTVHEDDWQVRLHWRTSNGDFDVVGAVVKDAQGLSLLDGRILKQCGAEGEPVTG